MWEAIGGIALACMAAGFITGLLYEKWHREREEFDAEVEAHETRIERNRAAGRHAKSQPRAFPSPAPAAAPPEPSRTALVRSGYRDSWREPGPVDLPRGGAIGVHLARAAVSAADIAQVFLPPQAAPDKHGAEDSGLMPRVRLTGETTGEIRMQLEDATDGWIAENCTGAEAIA